MCKATSIALCLVGLLTLVSVCQAIEVAKIELRPSGDVKAGKVAIAVMNIKNPEEIRLEITWNAKRGKVWPASESSSAAIYTAVSIYTAPLESGSDTITVQVKSDSELFTSKSASINVIHSERIIIPADENWSFETHETTQGISYAKPRGDVLDLTAHHIGSDDHISEGEAYLELSRIDIPALGQAPVDMGDKEISVQVRMQGEFTGYDGSAPPGFQVFLKSGVKKDKYYYGPWEDVAGKADSDWITVSLKTDGRALESALKDKRRSRDFDVRKVVRIGLKFAMGDGSNTEYSGKLVMRPVVVTPIEGR